MAETFYQQEYGTSSSASSPGTNQSLHTEIREGLIDNFLKAGEALSDGDIVALSTTCGSPYVVKATSGAVPYGISMQDVTSTGVKAYEERGFYSRTAKVGDPVAVYVCGGILKHKNTAITGASSGVFGLEAYVGTAGKLDSTTTGGGKVGIFVTNVDSAGIVKIKSYL